jgi:hypothetical protein
MILETVARLQCNSYVSEEEVAQKRHDTSIPPTQRRLLGADRGNPSPLRHHPTPRTPAAPPPPEETTGRSPHGGRRRWGFRLVPAASPVAQDLGWGGSAPSSAGGASPTPWASAVPCWRSSLASGRRGGAYNLD